MMTRSTRPTPRRIASGQYTYRGFHIDEVGRYDGTWEMRWNICAPGESIAHEATSTLGDAVALIDRVLKKSTPHDAMIALIEAATRFESLCMVATKAEKAEMLNEMSAALADIKEWGVS